MTRHPGISVTDLVDRLDTATRQDATAAICDAVKQVLCDVTNAGFALPASFEQPSADCYARHLLHRDPDDRYTVVIMVWGVGQQTPVHDHAGKWCVECVHKGRIRVESFELTARPDADHVVLRPQAEVLAGVGEAGALIPPFDYHLIANPDPTPSVTIHVYGGEIDGCHKYEPTDQPDVYTEEWCDLCYTTETQAC